MTTINLPTSKFAYKIKAVEKIHQLTRKEREKALKLSGYNPFSLSSSQVYIDLHTDSGTSALSQEQWAALMTGDESYAGSSSYEKLCHSVEDIFGYRQCIPTHQGRGAEQILLPLLLERNLGKGSPNSSLDNKVFVSNFHFDTTAAHVELTGSTAVNLVIEDAYKTDVSHPWKGNIDIEKLTLEIEQRGAHNVVALIMTVTCNSMGGQPVSMENLRLAYEVAHRHEIPVVMDAARFAENAWFIKRRDPNYANHSIKDIVFEMFKYADMMVMSAKKDAMVNIGGLCAIKDDPALYREVQVGCVVREGFPSYGGLAGRDVNCLAVGLYEALDEDYLTARIEQVIQLGLWLLDEGIPIQYPVGGHAVFIDAGKLFPHIPSSQFPGQALANELYLEGGIRCAEIGSFLLGRDPDTGIQKDSAVELTRLAIPRRVYSNDQLRYVVECMVAIKNRAQQVHGYGFVYEPPVLRHFLAHLEPIIAP
ncbi:tryptophanase [Vibrio sp. SCSIO 43135]|uniref:tryptophanase n=1 Tax=Vibrio sp. SCSIO 43135 TaxID=2819096 RepID=UPI0020750372|nr:tryptophanase [Vibrio sp. SCSIO 43135]USD43184.1 tryptophanase [Vibrio sp. SCSIO 43135]